MNSSGIAVQQFLTTSPQLFAPYKDEDIHGGPPLALVPAALSNTGRDYYLGIFHFFKVCLQLQQKAILHCCLLWLVGPGLQCAHWAHSGPLGIT
jgi:hypothetical protein